MGTSVIWDEVSMGTRVLCIAKMKNVISTEPQDITHDAREWLTADSDGKVDDGIIKPTNPDSPVTMTSSQQ